jgi:hypothetical protein
MRLVIDVPEEAYDDYREYVKRHVACLSETVIANGIPYEERPHGDLISRSEAEKLGATCLARRNENGQLEAIISLEEAGYSAGIKDAERPQGNKTEDDTPAGKWIPEEKTFTDLSGAIETYTRFKCDRCLQGQDFGPYPFCPWCGKRMNKDGTAVSDNTEDEQHGT